MAIARSLGRLAVVLLGAALALGVGIGPFWAVPEFTGLGIVETLPITPVVPVALDPAGVAVEEP